MTVYELDINKINSINGGMIISVANATSMSVSGTTIYFDEDGTNKQIQFAVNDYIRAQVYTGRGYGSYIGHITAVNHNATYGSANIVATTISGTPWNIMDLVQIGNSSDASRQSIIYLTASDTNNPYIDMLAGVSAGSFTDKQILRIGNLTGITDASLGALSGYGLYCSNVYLTGKLVLPNAGITDEGSTTRFYAGNTYANKDIAPFRVTQDGGIISNNYINITGICTASTMQVTDGLTSSIVIDESNIYEGFIFDDTGCININMLGYNAGTTKFRNTFIGDGKGTAIITVKGSSGGIGIGGDPGSNTLEVVGNLEVDGAGAAIHTSGDIDADGNIQGASLTANNGATDTFTTVDLKTVTVVNGIITSIA
jgi:hypothetical protein